MLNYKLFKYKKIIILSILIFTIGGIGIFSYKNIFAHAIKTKSLNRSTMIILKPHNNKQLDQLTYQTVTPGNSHYHHYLTTKQFANKFGYSEPDISKFTTYLRQNKLKPIVYANHLIIKVSGNKSHLNQAIEWHRRSKNHYKIPKYLSKSVLGVIGNNNKFKFNNYSFYSKHNNNIQNVINNGPQKFMDRYNMDQLYKNNNLGQGQSIGIISFANINQSDVNDYWQKENIPYKLNRIHVYNTNKNNNLQSGSDETTMDTEQAGAVAPKSNLNIYVSKPSVQGMVNSLNKAINQNKVSSLAISWGQSEQQVKSGISKGVIPKTYNDIMNLLFKQANVQGISTFASTGDNGAYDGMGENEYPGLTVDTPANSSYVTSVGGTSLPRSYNINNKRISINNERAWSNSLLYPEYNKNKNLSNNKNNWIAHYFSASGGGFSKLNSLPMYQRNVKGVGTYNALQFWTVNNDYLNELKKPIPLKGSQNGRNLPDISSNADPNTGYDMYYKGSWFLSGGTSIVSPQMAGASAVMNSSHSQRLGFWNPQIYKFANSSNSPFTPLNSTTDNNNLYYTGQSNSIYNQATGLGTINFGKLNNNFK